MKASDIASVIEQFAPIALQESWDNSGFCIGDPAQEVHSLMIGFDCTPSLVQQAVAEGADMIITHHPLIFGGISKISSSDMVGRTIIAAIKNGIVIYSCHTNMDKVIGGVSGQMARRLSLQDVKVLDRDVNGCGLGAIGTLPHPVDAETFLKMVKEAFSLKTLRSSHPIDRPIGRVAMCGGSGRSLIDIALTEKADAYISADISYHDFYCNDDFMIVDIGHYESEIDIVKTIYDIVREKIPTFAVQIAKKNINPVFYY